MQLMNASRQWAERPSDERFWDIEGLHKATLAHCNAARSATVANADLRVEAVDDQIQLVGRTGAPAQLTSWAFKQLCSRAEAPAGYLADLPATLAAQNLNHGLKANLPNHDGTTNILLHENGGYFARAMVSDKYTRIWNASIAARLVDFQDAGWRVPPARHVETFQDMHEQALALAQDRVRICTNEQAALSLTVRPGDLIGPAGLYASFEDMFAFMVHPERVIDDGTSEGLMRGFFVWNSEVGKSSFGVMKFLFRGVCGNHIVWDARDIAELKVRHIGNADDRAFGQLAVELKKYADETAGDDERRVRICREFRLASSADKVVDFVFSKMLLPRKTAEAALAAVQPEIDGDPTTVWGFAQGVTRLSQQEANADRRVALDRAAGKILEVAF